MVSQAASFSLSASPSTLNLLSGTRAIDIITVQPIAGFNGQVTLSTTGVPAGVIATFSKNPTMNSSNLSILVGRGVPTGAYSIMIWGSSGSAASAIRLTLNVQ
jgi:hypothetical protein